MAGDNEKNNETNAGEEEEGKEEKPKENQCWKGTKECIIFTAKVNSLCEKL